ncbi:transporter substrate-binding domain-containing protein [Shewanella dokdonensis]|uniref:histidine kinase n=1 Tax=Shewanella dokdonensis TaxID=712036 RepID=A0ABX8DDL6_9GAMM|nr:transporter substrate-binding domain-containing protein [Shewanella dokdonensis]QVK22819.1 transporter substrate-binding domain-containing protein [Shewanella dokdonensis]
MANIDHAQRDHPRYAANHLKCAQQYAPFEWQSENGEESGFNIELARYIAAQLHYDIEVKRQTLKQSLHAVTSKRWQLAVIAVPAGRQLDINTALPLLPTYVSAYNRRGEGNADNWQALKGKRVAIKQASSVAMYLLQSPQDFIAVPVVTNEQGFALLTAGKVDYVVSEFYCSRRMLSKYPLAKTAGKPLLYSQFYLIMSNKDPTFVAAVNKVINHSYDNGYFDDLLNKWVSFGKEKIELGQVRSDFFQGALITAIISSMGMLITLYISLVLRQKTKSLKRELVNRRKAEAEIKRVSAQFHSVLDGLPHGVCLLARDQHLIWHNGKYPWVLQPQQLAQAQPSLVLAQLVSATFAGAESQSSEFTFDGKRWKLELHRISDEMLALFIEDCTEQYELKQSTELSARLASLGELSAGIAHEINNPVGLITQSVTLMRDLLEDLRLSATDSHSPTTAMSTLIAELDYSCESVDDAAARIGRIVRDLKNFAQPGLEMHPKAVSINKVVETALRLTHNNVKRLQLQLQLDDTLPKVEGDELQLQLVLVNLIQNACLAMDKTEPLLQICTGVENGNIFVTVADNGCGMDPQTLARIREPFFTTRRSQGGTGLGLSTSNKILAEHQAQWQIRSRPGTGTEMKLLFRSIG